MYHAIVRQRIAGIFAAINQGNAEPVLSMFAPKFAHTFLGESALGGTRRTPAATRLWYERLYRLLPDIHFDIDRIEVAGPPWNTIAYVHWRETNTATDGVRTMNTGIHVVRLRFGRSTELIICPDTAGLAATLDRLSAAGTEEAAMPPILDSHAAAPL